MRPCLHRKNNGKAVQSNIKPVRNYYCMSDISCLNHGDRLKAAVHCFYRFIEQIFYFSHFEFKLPFFFLKHFPCIISEHIICLYKIVHASFLQKYLTSDLFNIYIMLTTSCVLHFIFTFSHLADAFIQSYLQMRTMEAIKINKRAMIRKCYNESQLA